LQRLPIVLPLALTLAFAVLAAPSASSAQACSAEPGYDPIESSDVIVGGRFQGWQEANDLAIEGDFTPIRVKMTVDRAFKGEVAHEITVIDRRSLISYGGERAWAGSSGACGAFDVDPAGMYAILGLYRAGDDYDVSNLSLLYIGAEPQGERYDSWIARLESIGENFPWLPATIAAVLGPLAFIFASSFVFRPGRSGG
jgi:hypothetical protein